MKTVALEAVKVNGRHRTDLGDLAALRESIDSVGLLHPVVVDSRGSLVAGQRRLEACRQLGWDEVPVNVADHLDEARAALEAERDENVCRLDMTPSEKVALGLALEELERPNAAQRKAEGQQAGGRARHGQLEGNVSPSKGDRTGKVYDLVGEAVGMSGPTYKRAKVVVKAAQEGNAVAAEALAEMDRTGKVTPAYHKVTGPPPPRPSKPISVETDRNRNVAAKAKLRIERAVGACNGMARGLDDLKVEWAVAVAAPDEIKGWDDSFGEAISAINRLRKRLKETS